MEFNNEQLYQLSLTLLDKEYLEDLPKTYAECPNEIKRILNQVKETLESKLRTVAVDNWIIRTDWKPNF